MTNEKMLEIMLNLTKAYPECLEVDGMAVEAIKQLREDIRKETQKKAGNCKRDALIKKVMKSAKAHTGRKDWSECYTPVDDKFGFIDGYRAYVLNDNYGYEVAKNEPFNLKAVKPQNAKIKVHVDLVDVELFNKENRAKYGKAWNKTKLPYVIETDEIKIGFNPDYLLEFCKMFNTDYIMCESPKSPAVYEDQNGEWGVLLPVRIND